MLVSFGGSITESGLLYFGVIFFIVVTRRIENFSGVGLLQTTP